MKRVGLSIALILAFIQFSTAQYVPEGFNYQAVVRYTNGDLVTNTQVALEIVLKEGSSNGNAIFAEKHTKTTNAQGIVQLVLGQGNVTQGNFSTIDWASAAKYISIAVDIDGNNVFTDLGSSQLLSVPYALYAKNAGNGGSGTTYTAGAGININGNTISATDNSTTNELQNLSIAGDQISISNGNTITLPPNSGTDAQTLSVNGNQLSISNGNTVTLPSGTGYTAGAGINIAGGAISNTGDLSNTNEIQSLTLVGSTLSISGSNSVNLPTGTTYTAGSGININGNTISATDNSATNEIQSITLVGSTLSISGSNSVNLPTGTTYSAGSGININGNTISATDNSATNEIQQLSLNGTTLSLNNGGGSVTLPSGGGNSYFESAGGNDIQNNNGGTVFLYGAPYQQLWVSGDNSSAALVAQNSGNGTGEALHAYGGNGKAIVADCNNGGHVMELNNPGGLGLKVTSNYYGIYAVAEGPVGGAAVYGQSNTIGPGGDFRNEAGGSALNITGAFNIYSPSSIFPGAYNVTQINGIDDALEVWDDWRPAAANNGFYNLGFSNARWNTVYAVNGVINTSDARQKQAIQPLSYGLQQVMAMKPVSFEWQNNPEQGRKIGFLAQDLQQVLPEVVSDKDWVADENGKKTSQPADALGVYYADIIPVLTKAIQEQQEMIDLLKQQNEALAKRVEALERN